MLPKSVAHSLSCPLPYFRKSAFADFQYEYHSLQHFSSYFKKLSKFLFLLIVRSEVLFYSFKVTYGYSHSFPTCYFKRWSSNTTEK